MTLKHGTCTEFLRRPHMYVGEKTMVETRSTTGQKLEPNCGRGSGRCGAGGALARCCATKVQDLGAAAVATIWRGRELSQLDNITYMQHPLSICQRRYLHVDCDAAAARPRDLQPHAATPALTVLAVLGRCLESRCRARRRLLCLCHHGCCCDCRLPTPETRQPHPPPQPLPTPFGFDFTAGDFSLASPWVYIMLAVRCLSCAATHQT